MDINRKKAQNEAQKDLSKSIEHLLTDIHEEINDEDRSISENVAHAQKRFYSLIANIAESNRKLSDRVLTLTIISVVFATIQIIPLISKFFKWFGSLG